MFTPIRRESSAASQKRTALRLPFALAVVMTALMGVVRGAFDDGGDVAGVSTDTPRCVGGLRAAVSGSVGNTCTTRCMTVGPRTWCSRVGWVPFECVGVDPQQLLHKRV